MSSTLNTQLVNELVSDMTSFAHFMYKPAGFKVARRLAPPVDTLQFYIDRFNSLNGDFSSSVSVALSSLNSSVAEADGKVAYIETTVQDAINNTAVEGGVLADTFVTVTTNAIGAIARTQRDVNAERISVISFGAKPAPFDSSDAFNKAIAHAAGRQINIPKGVFVVSNIIAEEANLVGAGMDLTELRLGDSTTDLLAIDKLTISNLTLSDNGRPDIARNAWNDRSLARCVDIFDSFKVRFKTDRNAMIQASLSDKSYTSNVQCVLERTTPSEVGDKDDANIFTSKNVDFIYYDRLKAKDMVGRTILGATYDHFANPEARAAVTAIVRDCTFDGFRHNAVTNTNRVMFFQGYSTVVEGNVFRDCFGRHIDILGRNEGGLSGGIYSKGFILHNKIDYTVGSQGIRGSDEDPVGSIYCRYGDACVANNHQDFSNLALTSALFVAINIRHGYISADVYGNTIINPKANGIAVDISDSIDTDKGVVNIYSNTITEATNSARPAIIVTNSSSTKQLNSVNIYSNSYDYSPSRAGIYLNAITTPARESSYAFGSVMILGNRNTNPNRKRLDYVEFGGYPEQLYAPNTDVIVTVDPDSDNKTGVINSISDALKMTEAYKCNMLTVSLASTFSSEVVLSHKYNVRVAPNSVVFNCKNSAGGQIRIQNDITSDRNGLILILDNNSMTFNDAISSPLAGTSLYTAFRILGRGLVTLNNCIGEAAVTYVNTTGVDVTITGGEINNITGSDPTSAIVRALKSDNIANISLNNLIGSNNKSLYYLETPAYLVYQDIDLGTEEGTKSFTTVV